LPAEGAENESTTPSPLNPGTPRALPEHPGCPCTPGALPCLGGRALGSIAYVRTTPAGDQIRLIQPDGLGDHLLWQTGVPEPASITDIQQPAWKPDASELAFTSSHETGCSLFESDIYALRADGVDYRRVSGPPACGSRAGLPTGTVIVPVINMTFSSRVFSIYFEGALDRSTFSLTPVMR
jgi:hypothetical protein